jgi:hypothetical protein
MSGDGIEIFLGFWCHVCIWISSLLLFALSTENFSFFRCQIYWIGIARAERKFEVCWDGVCSENFSWVFSVEGVHGIPRYTNRCTDWYEERNQNSWKNNATYHNCVIHNHCQRKVFLCPVQAFYCIGFRVWSSTGILIWKCFLEVYDYVRTET